MFRAVLVANRGEIAVRVLRTLRALGIRSVAVHTDADARAPHVALADTAVALGAEGAYLDGARIVAAALAQGATAVHPGYGFLAENAAFARACAEAGLTFVGPPPAAIEAMGDKIRAKALARAAGVPVLPDAGAAGMDDAALARAAEDVGYPLLVKPSAGGGGKGMTVVREPSALPAALAGARRLAAAAFGDDTLLLERWVERPRHVEVQVLADAHDRCLALGDRECSLQRRHQKVIEEAPAPGLPAEVRGAMGAAAVDLAQAVGYRGAGTVEFLLDGDDFFFLEMNTRLQVEHPVTEEVLGLDLVALQLQVAAGEPLALGPANLVPSGVAVEARVYAEDPDRDFLPTGGPVQGLALPADVRVDAGVAAGTEVGSAYDPMLAKVVAHAPERGEALRRLDIALAGTAVLGLTTNVAFLRRLLADPDVQAGRLDTGLIGRLPAPEPQPAPEEVAVLAALLAREAAAPAPGTAVDPFDLPSGWRVTGPVPAVQRLDVAGRVVEVAVRGPADGARAALGEGEGEPAALLPAPADELAAIRLEGGARAVLLRWRGATTRWVVAGEWVAREGRTWRVRPLPRLVPAAARAADVLAGPLRAPLPGTVTVVAVATGDHVRAGQPLLVVEAMKMEHPITAPIDGVVTKLLVAPGQRVALDTEVAVVEPDPGDQP